MFAKISLALLTVATLLASAFAQDAVRVPNGGARLCRADELSPNSSTTRLLNNSTSGRALTDVTSGSGLALGLVESTSEAGAVNDPQPTMDTANPTAQVFGEGQNAEIAPQPRRFVYNLSLTVRGVYDDNINISHADRVSDYYFAIEPSISLGLGDSTVEGANNLRFVYSPSILIFVDHSEADSVNHLIHLDGAHYFGHLSLTVTEDIAILDGTDIRSFTNNTSSTGGGVNIDVGGRTRENLYNTRLGASYDLTGKTFLSAGIGSSITDYPNPSLISSNEISGNLFINYRYSDKVTIGLGGSGGYRSVDNPSPDETFEQANIRFSYVLTGKINLNGSAGVEFRQFEDDSRGQYVSPVFDLSATYQMSDSTSFNLAASRRTYTSGVLNGQDFAGTTLSANVRQRFFQRVFVGLSGGFEINDYFETASIPTFPPVPMNRRDDYFFISPSVDVNVTRFWTVGAYYLHRQNDSSFDPFSFYDNQAGVRTTLTF